MGKKNRKEQFRESISKKPDGKGTGGDNSAKGSITGIIVGVMVAAAIGFTMLGGTDAAGGYKSIKASGGMVKIPVTEVSDGYAHYYSYKAAGGRLVNFFLLKSSDGIIRAAFDACDVCYQARKGYRQEGNEMVCNNCGQRFPSARINEVKGGCNPAPLNRLVEGEYLVLRATDIESGGVYF